MHLICIGVFTVDGKMAGFYGRVSPYPRIDANARDIPILVEAKNHPKNHPNARLFILDKSGAICFII